jgi:hypothetical protein
MQSRPVTLPAPEPLQLPKPQTPGSPTGADDDFGLGPATSPPRFGASTAQPTQPAPPPAALPTPPTPTVPPQTQPVAPPQTQPVAPPQTQPVAPPQQPAQPATPSQPMSAPPAPPATPIPPVQQTRPTYPVPNQLGPAEAEPTIPLSPRNRPAQQPPVQQPPVQQPPLQPPPTQQPLAPQPPAQQAPAQQPPNQQQRPPQVVPPWPQTGPASTIPVQGRQMPPVAPPYQPQTAAQQGLPVPRPPQLNPPSSGVPASPTAYGSPIALGPAYQPVAGAHRPKRGRGVLVGSLIAAVVAVLAAATAVYLVLNNVKGPTDPGTDTLAATDVTLVVRDDRVTLTWKDSSNGTAQPIIVGSRESEGLRRFAVPAKGSTEAVIPGLNKNFDYCFAVVLVYTEDDLKQSEQVCTNRKGASPSPSR